MNSDGSDQRQLTFNTGVTNTPSMFSPNGNQIAFYSDRDGDLEIFIIDSDGSGQRQLTFNDALDLAPRFSPDGSMIAFHSDREGDAEIFIMDVDGSGQTQLTFNDAFDIFPIFSPDGNQIAFYSDRDGDFEIFVGFITDQVVNDSPQFATPIGAVDAEISPAGDIDFYKFDASDSANYVIETSNLGPNMDSFLVLFDTDGVTELDSNDDIEQGNLASRIEWTAPSSGTYFVMVRHFSEEGTGTYTISIEERVVVEVEVPGPERIVEVQVPGPERIVEVQVPGPERIVEVEGPERVVEVPGPERIVEIAGPERIVEVPGPEVEVQTISPISYVVVGLGILLVVMSGLLFTRRRTFSPNPDQPGPA